ncbi:MAG: (p)ppGpp synthetase [Betaproteobacteria bacterium]
MGKSTAVTDPDVKEIERVVKKYSETRKLVDAMLAQLKSAVEGSDDLMKYVHSLRWRTKDPAHLKDKLKRKLDKAKKEGSVFDVSVENYMDKINDLAGLRILHLHSTQIGDIDRGLKNLFKDYRYEVIEEATARTWDIEYKQFYEGIGIKTVENERMYTSVHYVVSPSRETRMTCEIQVRTLAEELWGEVDHSMNYPHKTKISTCMNQIKVLARVTSSCSRLVDSIYSAAEVKKTKKKPV